MPSHNKKFDIPGKDSTAIYEAICKNVDAFLAKASLGEYTLTKDDSKKSLSFKASMASGTLTAIDNAMKVDLQLSFLAVPFKSKIDEGIQKWLGKAFS